MSTTSFYKTATYEFNIVNPLGSVRVYHSGEFINFRVTGEDETEVLNTLLGLRDDLGETVNRLMNEINP